MMRWILTAWMMGMALSASAQVFDGKSLDGWKVTGADCWKAADGVISGKNDPDLKGSILWTQTEYEDFDVELEFRFQGAIDSGVFLRGENDQIQIGVSRSLKRDMTGSPYIASKGGYPKEAAGVAPLLKEGAWNRMKIEVRGAKYRVFLDGKEVLEYDSDTVGQKGPVGLQMHPGVEMSVDFRKIEIRPVES
ncbi:hypothetical protein HNR46_003590 [Haloferula luteola]|uniref:3-keto-alpha-glucoside-1,2-lyase/3-keto-2-hydroxy-glucal hydratase domain-containing protein n=1 Tax=Haloferula luteola TaxID=595692 RepID=A0A840VCS9_9BACT|nr:DUF1080 domain-containing protein [Haloferula luteola]MBB5353334.1 hypothetical protein [Haloferula luteola]